MSVAEHMCTAELALGVWGWGCHSFRQFKRLILHQQTDLAVSRSMIQVVPLGRKGSVYREVLLTGVPAYVTWTTDIDGSNSMVNFPLLL